MDKIIVLLSTYNGQNYLKEQLDSIFAQRNVDIVVQVRDDGSTDDTINILQRYGEKEPRLHFYQGDNIKPAKSFFELLNNSLDATYYAFCDQDDIWENNKIESAINCLKRFDDTIPLLYYSDLKIVDEKLNFIKMYNNRKLLLENRYSVLVENYCTGCTAVFNKELRDIVISSLPTECTMHDAWMNIVCTIFGKCIYDENSYILYRQHANNVIGASIKTDLFKSIKSKIGRVFNRKLQPRYTNAVNFYYCFENILSEKDRNKILKILNYKKSFKDRLALLCDNDIVPTKFWSKIRFKLHVIWGTV